jgi:NTP pyrophosphatase (non-canonical NTP hydrolase)
VRLNEYQAEAVKTVQDNVDEVYLSGKLMSEGDEIFQPALKHKYHSKRKLTDEEFNKELGDCLWYVAALADSRGLNLDDVARDNIAKLRERHGESYRQEFYTGEKDAA